MQNMMSLSCKNSFKVIEKIICDLINHIISNDIISNSIKNNATNLKKSCAFKNVAKIQIFD